MRGAPGPVPAATAEETEKILRWLESPGVRLVDVDGEWACPRRRARHLALYDAVNQSRLSLVPFDEQRLPRRCTGPSIGPWWEGARRRRLSRDRC